jgi:hypothetical protein
MFDSESEDIAAMLEQTLFGLLSLVDRDEIVLPAMQRPFVWKEDRIYRLVDSLLRGFPIGAVNAVGALHHWPTLPPRLQAACPPMPGYGRRVGCAGCEGGSGVGEGEEPADCEGQESVVLLGSEGVLGASMFSLGRELRISTPSVNEALSRGQQIAEATGRRLMATQKRNSVPIGQKKKDE